MASPRRRRSGHTRVLALLVSLSAPACAFTPGTFGACRRPGGLWLTGGRAGLAASSAPPRLGKLPPLGAVSMLLLAGNDGSRPEWGPGRMNCGGVRRRCSLPALDAAQGRDGGQMSQDYVSENSWEQEASWEQMSQDYVSKTAPAEPVAGWSRGEGRLGSLSEGSIHAGEKRASERRLSERSTGRDGRNGMRGVGGGARGGGGRGGYRVSAPGTSDARRGGVRGSDGTTASVKEVPPTTPLRPLLAGTSTPDHLSLAAPVQTSCGHEPKATKGWLADALRFAFRAWLGAELQIASSGAHFDLARR